MRKKNCRYIPSLLNSILVATWKCRRHFFWRTYTQKKVHDWSVHHNHYMSVFGCNFFYGTWIILFPFFKRPIVVPEHCRVRLMITRVMWDSDNHDVDQTPILVWYPKWPQMRPEDEELINTAQTYWMQWRSQAWSSQWKLITLKLSRSKCSSATSARQKGSLWQQSNLAVVRLRVETHDGHPLTQNIRAQRCTMIKNLSDTQQSPQDNHISNTMPNITFVWKVKQSESLANNSDKNRPQCSDSKRHEIKDHGTHHITVAFTEQKHARITTIWQKPAPPTYRKILKWHTCQSARSIRTSTSIHQGRRRPFHSDKLHAGHTSQKLPPPCIAPCTIKAALIHQCRQQKPL